MQQPPLGRSKRLLAQIRHTIIDKAKAAVTCTGKISTCDYSVFTLYPVSPEKREAELSRSKVRGEKIAVPVQTYGTRYGV